LKNLVLIWLLWAFTGRMGGWKCKDSNGSREFYVILRKSEKTRKSFSNFIIYMKESLKIFLTFVV